MLFAVVPFNLRKDLKSMDLIYLKSDLKKSKQCIRSNRQISHLISGQSLESGPKNLLVLDGASRVLLLEMPLDLLRVLRPLRTELALVGQNVFEGRNFVNFEQIFGLSTDDRLFDDDRTNGRFGKFDALWLSNLRV